MAQKCNVPKQAPHLFTRDGLAGKSVSARKGWAGEKSGHLASARSYPFA